MGWIKRFKEKLIKLSILQVTLTSSLEEVLTHFIRVHFTDLSTQCDKEGNGIIVDHPREETQTKLNTTPIWS